MEYVHVQDEQVPALGLGTWMLDGGQCRSAVMEALELGYRHIDTAQMYGNEGDVGAALRSALVDRGDVFLTTKLANGNHAPDDVRRSVDASLSALGTEYVDLLLIHWPGDPEQLPYTLEAMRGLHDDGKVRHLGVSNFPAPLLREATAFAPIFCDQVEYHPLLDQSDLLTLAREHDVLVTAYSPLARGKVLDDPTLVEIADAHHKQPAQVALRWLLDQDRVAAIPKASGRDHLTSNLDVFDFRLTDAERARIDGIARGERIVDPPHAPDWDVGTE